LCDPDFERFNGMEILGTARSSLKTDLFRSNRLFRLTRWPVFGIVFHTVRKRLRNSLADNGLLTRAFPRHCWRGSIEAYTSSIFTRRISSRFRAIVGAAPLKLGSTALHPQMPCLFPRHCWRGSIEADSQNALLAFAAGFRAIVGAAPLKLP